MVIVETGLQQEGLLSRGYDWYVQEVTLSGSALASKEFNGVLANWKQKVAQKVTLAQETDGSPSVKLPQDLTVAELIGSLKPAQLWSVLAALAALVAGAFAAGAKLFGKM